MRAPSALVEVEPACEEVELAYDWSGWEEWLRGYLDIERQLLIEGLGKALGMVPASVGVGGRGGNDPPGASLYPAQLFARLTRGHCAALAMPITLMTAPSVITPRSANQLRKAKQLSGTATASNKSRFMVKCLCLWLRPPPNSSRPPPSDNAVQKISEQHWSAKPPR
jgi:hypothetical protein